MTRNRPSDAVDIRHGDALDVLRGLSLTPSARLPMIPRSALPPDAPPRPPAAGSARIPADIRQQMRPENMISLASVDFTAPCPGCGEDVKWAQHREDTHTHTVVDCRACPKTYRACAACPPAAA